MITLFLGLISRLFRIIADMDVLVAPLYATPGVEVVTVVASGCAKT